MQHGALHLVLWDLALLSLMCWVRVEALHCKRSFRMKRKKPVRERWSFTSGSRFYQLREWVKRRNNKIIHCCIDPVSVLEMSPCISSNLTWSYFVQGTKRNNKLSTRFSFEKLSSFSNSLTFSLKTGCSRQESTCVFRWRALWLKISYWLSIYNWCFSQ